MCVSYLLDITLTLLWPHRTACTTCSIYKQHSSWRSSRRDTKVLFGVLLWGWWQDSSAEALAFGGACGQTEATATTDPARGHERPLRCAFGLGVCQRVSGCVLSPCPRPGKVARQSLDSRVPGQSAGVLPTRVGSVAR